MPDDPRDIDDLALLAYQRLLTQDAEGALPYLEQALVELGPEVRPALRARLLGWQAQALLSLRRPAEASTAALRAVHAARAAEDADGIKALRELQQQAAAQAAALRVRPDTADSPLALAVQAFDEGNLPRAELLALGAREQARRDGDPREEVFALLALARLPHRTARAIAEAAQVADQSGDHNLITAVSRAARAAGVVLAQRVF